MGKTGRTNNSYTEELKIEAVRLVTEENMSYREEAKQLGIRNKTQVVVWVNRHKTGQPFKQETIRKGRPKSKFTSVEIRLQEQLLEEHIMAIYRLHPYFGYLRMTVALKLEGIHANHKLVYRLMKELGIRSVIRKKRRYFGKQVPVVHPNRLERKFHAETPLRKLVTDITYIRVICFLLQPRTLSEEIKRPFSGRISENGRSIKVSFYFAFT
ncbi:IS3 family transposase [Paenibacillus sp. MER TA 81-3]|nr:IS3 family transposase [Paenibacillus sp. MER TA 81-3]MCM3340618.1 IS3 family transposase [Paenibacillus sp. MER TA 81-3]